MMKKILFSFITLFFILVIIANVFSEAGPPIPNPKITVTEAIEIAKNYFYFGKSSVIDSEYFKIEDYILLSAQYTNYFMEEYQNEWAWKIRFVHPIQNDHSVTYKVTNNGEIFEQEVTE